MPVDAEDSVDTELDPFEHGSDEVGAGNELGDDEDIDPGATDPALRARPTDRPRPTAPILLGLGACLWVVVAALRCTGPEAPTTPPLTVAQTEDANAPRPPATPEPDARGKPPAEETREDPPPAEDDATPLPPGENPRPEPAPWARNPTPPKEVSYTIRRGGTLENVANLFKIYHHEIVELNPGIDLKKELAPQTKVVVYRQEQGARSESVGFPSAGSLEGGVPMVEGPGRRLMAIPWKSWATGHTVALLDLVLRRWAETGGNQPILVGNLSSRHGGKLEPHGTHQSGRDADLGYPQKLVPGEEHNWREMNASNLDGDGTWKLLQILVETGRVEVIYIDRQVQKLLYEHALANKLLSKRALAAWMEYPRPTGSGHPLIRHVPGHVDHLHVRFDCRPEEDRCKSR